MENNIRDKVVLANPKSENERARIAGQCVRKCRIKIPAVLDEFGNSTEAAYTAWPDRLVSDRSPGSCGLQEQARPVRIRAGTTGTRAIGSADAVIQSLTRTGAGVEWFLLVEVWLCYDVACFRASVYA